VKEGVRLYAVYDSATFKLIGDYTFDSVKNTLDSEAFVGDYIFIKQSIAILN